MGAAAVYEWDLLFPDLLDVFVLSVLPISTRRLFFARVLALTIFLGAVLIGTSILGTLFFPVVAICHASVPSAGPRTLSSHEWNLRRRQLPGIAGHPVNTVGPAGLPPHYTLSSRGLDDAVLAVLLFYPAVCHSIMPLLTSDSTAVSLFSALLVPGRLRAHPARAVRTAIFSQLAHTACNALMLMLSIVLLTYPLAYRRRVRQLIEGAGVIDNPSRTAAPLRHLLHTVILRHPAQRAVFTLLARPSFAHSASA